MAAMRAALEGAKCRVASVASGPATPAALGQNAESEIGIAEDSPVFKLDHALVSPTNVRFLPLR